MLFTFPSRYLFTIGRQGVFSLRRWASRIPAGLACPAVLGCLTRSLIPFAYRTLTFCGPPFQVTSARDKISYSSAELPSCLQDPATPDRQRRQAVTPVRFRLFRFRSPLLTESLLLSFPGGTWMFRFPPFSTLPYVFRQRWHALRVPGFPIRTSPDQRPLAAPRGFSQLATSFLNSWRQGIRHVPLLPRPLQLKSASQASSRKPRPPARADGTPVQVG